MKVLLIGNGPSALENKMGSRIDSDEFDIVCRLNRGHRQDNGDFNKGFEEFTGTRCDYWIISDLRINLALKRYNDYSGIFVVTPKFKWNENLYKSINHKYPNIIFIPYEYEDNINNIVNFNPKWPSTGVVSIHFLAEHFDDIYIYGFDTYSKKYDNLHYFENKPNKYKISNNKDHNPQLEKDYITYMINKRKIKKLI